jgi:alpha-N-arabinofuranosidase
MFANHIGNEVVSSVLAGAGDRVFYSVTRDAAKGMVYVKLVNAASTPIDVNVSLDGAKAVKPAAKLVRLTGGSTAATNTIDDPKRVVPVESTVKAAKEFLDKMPGYSIDVLEIGVQ